MSRRALAGALAAFAAVLLLAPAAFAKQAAVEVIDVSGIIDGPVEHAVVASLRKAEREGASLVVLQINSRGVVDAARTVRLAAAISRSRVPVATWVGPAGSRAAQGAVVVAMAGYVRAMAPGSAIGPLQTLDLRMARSQSAAIGRAVRATRVRALPTNVFDRAETAQTLRERGLVDHVSPSIADLLDQLHITERALVRFHKPGLLGRVLHAAAQPSIAYLLLLLGFVGIVFELFHPSTGPAGVAGFVSLGLGLYGLVVLGGSWLAFGLLAAAIAGFAVDLRFSSLGVFTLLGLAGLVAGSLLLFPSPFLRASPWVLAVGIVGMIMFLLGAMTRVLRDLRAVARGELEVQDAHQHPQGGH